MNPPQALIEVRDACIGYSGHVVGRPVSLRLGAGEILCLLGPNGSGKSTLFRSILGLIPLCGGEVRVLGRPLSAWSRRALARQLAYVPQAHQGMFAFSVFDVVLMGRQAHSGLLAAPSSHDRDVVCQSLDTMGMLSLAQRPYTAISGGERQLVLIARALAQESPVLIMDEPTASLDFGNQIRVLAHIARLRDDGRSVLFCTHQPEHAARVADRVALFRQGRVHYDGKPGEALNIERLAWLYDLNEAAVRVQLSALGAACASV